MRVLQLIQTPQRRGAEVFAMALSGALRRRGVTVRTAFLYPHPGPGSLALGPDDVVLGDDAEHVTERWLGFNPALARRVLRCITDFEPDVVQVNGSRTVKYGALARVASGRRWVLIYRNIGDPRIWLAKAGRRAFYRHFVMRRLDGAVAVSDATMANLRSVSGVRAPIARIPRAIDIESFRPRLGGDEVRRSLGTPDGVPVVIFVGSLTPEKRPDRLIRVFGAVREAVPGACLWVVGDGALRASTERQAIEAGLSDAVTWLGVRDDVADLVGASDLMLVTSDTEGIPGVVLEAAALSKPTVATSVGGIGECIVAGRTGLLAPRDDEASLAAAVVKLLGDENTRRAMGIEAHRWVAEAFALDAVADRYVTFYGEALRQRSRPRHLGRALA